MENQAIIPMKLYNELVAFKEMMEKEQFIGRVELYYSGPGGGMRAMQMYGRSDVIQGLKAEIEQREKTISEQWQRIRELENSKPESKKKWWQW